MKVKNEVYKSVKIDWDNIVFPLKEGSPISPGGIVTNDKRAIGLIPYTYKAKPLMEKIYVLVGGDVLISDVKKDYGEDLSSAAMSNMYGIRFHYDDGNVFHAVTEGGGIETYKDIQHHVRTGDIENYLLPGDSVTIEGASLVTGSVEGTGVTAVSVVKDTFIGKVGEKNTGSYVFTYSGSAWELDGEEVNVTQYGISFTGTAAEDDTATIVYSITTTDYEVEGIDEECAANASAEHVLSLVRKDVLGLLAFDPEQYLFAVTAEACAAFEWPTTGADAGMPAGTYNITLNHGAYDGGTGEDGTYQFTTTKIIPIGGGIRHSKIGISETTYQKSNITGGKFTTYKADRLTALETNLATTEGSSGTDLGTTTCKDPQYKDGDYINFSQRQAYGSNRWSTSYIRQVLNSKDATVQFVPGTIWSRPVSTTLEGFLHSLSPDVVDVLGKVKKRYAKSIADGYGYEDIEDTVTLVNMLDLGSGKNNSISEGPVDGSGTVKRETAKSLWKNVRTSNATRTKRDSTSTARNWWIGSTYPANANGERYVNTSGALNYSYANYSGGVVPVLHVI